MNNDLLLTIIKAGVEHKYFNKQSFVLGLFSFIAEDEYETDEILIKDKSFYIKVNEEEILLTNKYTDKLLELNTPVDLPKDILINNSNNIKTTIGRVVMNYLLLVRNFGTLVPYINESFKVKDIENKYIAKLLTEDPNDLTGIQIKQYQDFITTVTYIEGFSKVLSLAATYKSMVAPDGIDEYKAKVMKELDDKYGKGWHNDAKITAELDAKLTAYDEEWLKGDDANGRLLYGKTKLARKKMFLNMGIANSAPGKVSGTTNSLQEGWGTNKENLATLFNDSLSGSISRGNGVRDGGVMAKVFLRSSNDINVVEKDCGSTIGLTMVMTNKLIGRFMLVKNQPILITDEIFNKLKGKEIAVRSPLYCKLKKDFCYKCLNNNLKNIERAVSLMSINTAGDVLKADLAKFHATKLELVNITLDVFS